MGAPYVILAAGARAGDLRRQLGVGFPGQSYDDRFLIDYAHSMLCLDGEKVMRAEIKGKHIPLVSPSHHDDGVLSTEPLIISVHLSGIPARPLLQLLDFVAAFLQ